MDAKIKLANRSLIQFNKLAVAWMLALSLLLPLAAWSGGVVTNCTEANLRAALAGGGTVTFACDGTITLTSTFTNVVDTILDGTGRQVTISGGNSVRVFYVNSNVTFTVINLTIANGASSKGAGIFNDGGTLNLFGTSITRNNANGFTRPSASESGEGGGVYNRAGVVNAATCTFSNNSAYQANWEILFPPFLQALGGAIRNESGVISLQDCQFTSNRATGGDGWSTSSSLSRGLDGYGGAIHNSGALTAIRCSFLQNSARGGAGAGDGSYSYPNPAPPGSSAGSGAGGAVCNLGTLILQASTLASNTAAGGAGGRGAYGHSESDPGGHITDGGGGGEGGCANGGALLTSGAANLINNTIAWNSSAAGAGGAGGAGGSALLHGDTPGAGGAGGAGGAAFGGGISGGVRLVHCTLAFNSAALGNGGAGGGGGMGNGRPAGPSGTNGINGVAGGGGITVGTCVNTLLATNLPGGNGSGPLTDLGHNLSSDATCGFSNVGSLNNTDPMLGPLTNNGGPTLTMTLLPGSPAIDAGDSSAAPPIDQRGFPRPAGLAFDIGAFEYGSMLPVLAISRSGATGMNILVHGNANQPCRLLTSTNLSDWQCVATNQIGPDGTVLFQDSGCVGETQRFYKVALP